jgi:hypothetical protein
MKLPVPTLAFAALLTGIAGVHAGPQAQALFDGKSLDGWDVKSGVATYKVENGTIVGTTVEGSPNTFLCTQKTFGDFVLTFEVKCAPELNSGVQFRSEAYAQATEIEVNGKKRKHEAGRVFGYQVEIATSNAGRVYDEARRATWLDTAEPSPEAKAAFKADDWNAYRVIAQGDHIQTFVNGVKVADFHDTVTPRGFFGLQVHGIKQGTGPFSVAWRNIQLRELAPGENP